MSRVKGGFTRARNHRELKKAVKGFGSTRRRRIKTGSEALLSARKNAFIGRKLKKRTMRNLWVVRLNAALRLRDLSYSKFIGMLNTSPIKLNRKMLSDLAIHDLETFNKVIDQIASK